MGPRGACALAWGVWWDHLPTLRPSHGKGPRLGALAPCSPAPERLRQHLLSGFLLGRPPLCCGLQPHGPQCSTAERVGALPPRGALAWGGGLEARQGWGWLQSVRGSVPTAGEQATARSTGGGVWERALQTQAQGSPLLYGFCATVDLCAKLASVAPQAAFCQG